MSLVCLDLQQWSEQYHQKQIALQGKFTFPAAVPLENPEGLAPGDISLIHAIDVRFSYKPETNVFIFNDPISFNVTAATRCGVMGPNGADQIQNSTEGDGARNQIKAVEAAGR